MPRKTINVADLVDVANKRLAIKDVYLKAPGKDRDMTPDEAFRMGVVSVLEHFLHTTDNYCGYGFQEGQVTRYATEPGESPEITDETRRVYYGPKWRRVL